MDTPASTPASPLKSVLPDLEEFTGLVYPPEPEGLSAGFAVLITSDWPEDFGLAGVHLGQRGMLWFAKSAGMRGDEVKWEIADILELPPLDGADEVLVRAAASNKACKTPRSLPLPRWMKMPKAIRSLRIPKSLMPGGRTGKRQRYSPSLLGSPY